MLKVIVATVKHAQSPSLNIWELKRWCFVGMHLWGFCLFVYKNYTWLGNSSVPFARALHACISDCPPEAGDPENEVRARYGSYTGKKRVWNILLIKFRQHKGTIWLQKALFSWRPHPTADVQLLVSVETYLPTPAVNKDPSFCCAVFARFWASFVHSVGWGSCAMTQPWDWAEAFIRLLVQTPGYRSLSSSNFWRIHLVAFVSFFFFLLALLLLIFFKVFLKFFFLQEEVREDRLLLFVWSYHG